MPNGSFEMKLL